MIKLILIISNYKMIEEIERLAYLLQQTYTSSDTETIRQVQKQLEEACRDTKLPKMIFEIVKSPNFDNQLKFASTNLIHKKWMECVSQIIGDDMVKANSTIASLNKIIEDASIYGEIKIPIIKTSFYLQLKNANRGISIYVKLAGSVSYYCRVKRTVLGMVMLNEILKLNRPGQKLTAVLAKEEELKMTVLFKKQIFKKCIGDCITSVYHHLKQIVDGKGHQIDSDGYTSFEQFYRGWETVSLTLCQFNFDKYYESVPDIFQPKSINNLLEIIVKHPLFQNQQSTQVRNNGFRVMTYLFTNYIKANLYNKFPQFGETVKQISQDLYAKVIEDNKSIDLVDSVTDLFLAIIKESNFLFQSRPLLRVQYFVNFYFLPIYQSFYQELSGVMKEQDYQEILRLIGFMKYPQYHRKNNRDSFQLKCMMEHPHFYNIACILGAILQKIPDTQVIIYQYLLSLIDESNNQLFGFPDKSTRCNVGLLLIIALAENLNKYSEFINKIFGYILNHSSQNLTHFTNPEITHSQNSIIFMFLFLNTYNTYADQVSIMAESSNHELPESFLHIIPNFNYPLIVISSLTCLETYLQQGYNSKQEKERVKILINKLLQILKNYGSTNKQSNQFVKTTSIIFFNAFEAYSEIFSQNQFQQIFIQAFQLMGLVEPNKALQLCNKILKNKQKGYQQITHTLFNKLIPFILGLIKDQQTSEDLTHLCCDIILSVSRQMQANKNPQIQRLNSQIQSALMSLIINEKFPNNHQQNTNIFVYRLFWKLQDTRIGHTDQFLMPLFLFKCLFYLNTIDMPCFTIQKYLGDSVYSASRFFLMANWIIKNYSNQINQNHVNMALDILDKLVLFKNRLQRLYKQPHSRSFIYGKMKLLTLHLVLRVPEITFFVMRRREWLEEKNIFCENYEQAAIFFICSSTVQYQLEYDIPFITMQLTEKLNTLLTPGYQNDLGLAKYAHLYLKLCIECVQKVHFRNTYSDRKFQSEIQRSQLKNLSRDGFYENDVSEQSEGQCEEGIKMMSYYLCLKELARINEQMNALPKQKYQKFINQFFSMLSRLKKNRANWLDKVMSEYISKKTNQNIRKMIDVKNWNQNFLKHAPRKRIYLKVKNSG